VKEKRKGPISLAGGLVDSVAATVRRMQRDREPRVLAYDPTGYARLIQPESRGHERILEIGETMVALVSGDGAEPAGADDGADDDARKPRSRDAKARRGGTRPRRAANGNAGRARSAKRARRREEP
jgi:hypothetical protein